MRLPIQRSPWDLLLGAVCLAVGLSPRLPEGLAASMAPVAGSVLLLAAFLWYWRRQMYAKAEEFAKLRTAGLAIQVLWLTVLYGLTANLLPLGAALDRTLSDLLVAAGCGALAVAVMVALDLSVHRMSRRGWLVAAGLAAVALVSRASGAVWGTLSLSGLVLGLVAPMGWLITLERRQRNLVLAGGFLSLIPLGATAALFSLQPLSPQMFLTDFIRFGALFCLTYAIMLLVRAAQAISGASLYERKVEELDAVYDFGLNAATALDPEEFHLAVLHSLQRIGKPDVAAVVEPDSWGQDSILSVLRADGAGEHVYRHRTRVRWSNVADEFTDRRPLVVDDHRRSQPGPLQRIWEPASGSSVSVPVLSAEGQPRALLIAGRHQPNAFSQAEIVQAEPMGGSVIGGEPVHSFELDESARFSETGGKETGLGDVILRSKYHLMQDDAGAPFDFSMLGQVTFATGDEDDLLGTGETKYRAMLIASKTLGRVTPHVNVAYEVAGSNADLENFTYAVGFDARVSNRVTVALELLGRSNPHVDAIGNDVVDAAFAVKFNPFDRYNLPLNAFVSVPVNDDGLRSDAIWGLGFDLILN